VGAKMFELTMNGQTREFETALEMQEWRERMMKPSKKTRQVGNSHKKPKPVKRGSMSAYLNKMEAVETADWADDVKRRELPKPGRDLADKFKKRK